MQTSYLIGIISTVFALLSIVVGFIVKDILYGLRERVKVLEAANNAAVLQSRLDAGVKDREALWDEIGRSSQEGMRKTVHDTRNLVTRAMGGVDDQGRRIERLEKRVFNGERH